MNAEVTTVKAIVRSVEGEDALVEVESGGCGRCHEEGGCGGNNLTQMMCAGPKSYRVARSGAAVGEHVVVAIGTGVVRRSANIAYVVPLLGLLSGAVVGMQIGGDPGAIAGGGGGLALAWLAGRYRLHRELADREFQPYIVRP